MAQAATLLLAAHSDVDTGDYQSAEVYYTQALTELAGAEGQGIDRQRVRDARERIKQEIQALAEYQRKLTEFERSDFASARPAPPASAPRAASPPTADQESNHIFQQQLRAPMNSNNNNNNKDPTVWDPPPPRPRVAPTPVRGSARHQAPSNWKGRPQVAPGRGPPRNVQAKVDSRRSGPGAAGPSKGRGKKQEEEPWESWSGQDKELAANLASDIMDSSPGVRWEDIAGLVDAKRILKEAMILPLLRPELFQGLRKPVKGVLLFGPPGTGKTLLAKALATETDTTFFSVSSSTLASKWRGESERMVRVMFDMARAKAPATIFIDEIDSLCSQRGEGGDNDASRRVKTEILIQTNGMQSGEGEPRVMVMGATNFPWDLDEALRRRLEKRIYIPLPNHEDRVALLRINVKGVECAADVDFDDIARMGEGYSCDDISNVCREAAMFGMRRAFDGKGLDEIKNIPHCEVDEPLRRADFVKAFKGTRPSVGQRDLVKHEEWRAEYGST